MQTENQSPADKVIEAFGGLTKTARAVGVAVTTVQGWKERKRVPQEHWSAIRVEAEKIGKPITLEDLLGATEPDRVAS